MTLSPYHHAIPVHSVPEGRVFYGDLLGCVEGRRDGDRWQDYNFFGHQLVLHYVGSSYRAPDYYNPVDGDEVPVPHFGVCLSVVEWTKLRDRITRPDAPCKVAFVVKPHLRFVGTPGEQHTMFFKDPSGNSLEFKAMTNKDNLFAKYDVAAVGARKPPTSKL
eukprot:PhM_4_TR2613/c0_g1_i1/m.16702